MKIAPLPITDPWSHRLARNTEADAHSLQSVPCDIAVRMEVVSMLHHGANYNYRPYLHLQGKLLRVQPDIELPYGITELPFHPGSEPIIDAFYEFSPAQLAELVRKGYFGTRFRVPESMMGIVWDLPAEVDFLVFAPENMEQPPLVFVGVHDQNSAVLTEKTSGYTLAEYFPNYSFEEPEEASDSNEYPISTHSGMVRDLFAGEELEDRTSHQPGEFFRHYGIPVQSRQAPKSVFDRLIDEAEAQLRTKENPEEPDLEHDNTKSAELMHEQVAPNAKKVLGSETEHVPSTTEVDFIDFGREADETTEGKDSPIGTSAEGIPEEPQREHDDHQPGL